MQERWATPEAADTKGQKTWSHSEFPPQMGEKKPRIQAKNLEEKPLLLGLKRDEKWQMRDERIEPGRD